MEDRKVRTVPIASGSGTDFNAILTAHRGGFIPNVELVSLISTSADAGCLEKARAGDLPAMVIDRQECGTTDEFNRRLGNFIRQERIELIFLVGCIVKVYPIEGVVIYNIHPASLYRFGGKTMYGLKVHQKVLENFMDLIVRGRKKISDNFFTYPTVHQADLDYDSGDALLVRRVKIPQSLIEGLMSKVAQFNSADLLQKHVLECAELLQKHVLPYEWKMLPVAVKMAAQRIVDEKKSQ